METTEKKEKPGSDARLFSYDDYESFIAILEEHYNDRELILKEPILPNSQNIDLI